MLRRMRAVGGGAALVRLVQSLISAALLVPQVAQGAVVPPGFAEQLVTSGLKGTTAIEFAPDGRLFVIEKQGTVWIVENGTRLPTPFLDLRDEVHNAADKGLIGLALDPAFASNGWVYLLYAVDPVFGAPDEVGAAVTFGRLTRYTAVGNFADLGSRTVLMGHAASDGFPQCTKIHGVGTLRFAHDGTLFVGCGDGAWADRVDFGQNLTPEDPDCEGMFGAAQDVGAARAQGLNTLAGKILRIDPLTGQGLSTNPFWDGDPHSPASKIWAMGLRNAFRFSVKPGSEAPGTLFISEVGWSTWEELNVAHLGGMNFGWPCREGTLAQPLYDADSRSDAWCSSALPGIAGGSHPHVESRRAGHARVHRICLHRKRVLRPHGVPRGVSRRPLLLRLRRGLDSLRAIGLAGSSRERGRLRVRRPAAGGSRRRSVHRRSLVRVDGPRARLSHFLRRRERGAPSCGGGNAVGRPGAARGRVFVQRHLRRERRCDVVPVGLRRRQPAFGGSRIPRTSTRRSALGMRGSSCGTSCSPTPRT